MEHLEASLKDAACKINTLLLLRADMDCLNALPEDGWVIADPLTDTYIDTDTLDEVSLLDATIIDDLNAMNWDHISDLPLILTHITDAKRHAFALISAQIDTLAGPSTVTLH